MKILMQRYVNAKHPYIITIYKNENGKIKIKKGYK